MRLGHIRLMASQTPTLRIRNVKPGSSLGATAPDSLGPDYSSELSTVACNCEPFNWHCTNKSGQLQLPLHSNWYRLWLWLWLWLWIWLRLWRGSHECGSQSPRWFWLCTCHGFDFSFTDRLIFELKTIPLPLIPLLPLKAIAASFGFVCLLCK